MKTVNVSVFDKSYDFEISGTSYIGNPVSGTAMYVGKKVEHLVNSLSGIKNCLVFAENGVNVTDQIKKDNCFVFTANPQYDYGQFVSKLYDCQNGMEKDSLIKLNSEGYYEGTNVTIGRNCYIEPGVVIGSNVVIGDNAVILAGAVIKNAIIGDNFLCNENATIGANAFTMSKDAEGKYVRIPSMGRVIIGNNVEIGTHDNVSRGSAGDTVIEDNVKVDTLIHIAHDVHIKENSFIVAGTIIGGYTEIGVNGYTGMNSCIRNRVKLGDNSLIGMGAVVTKGVEEGTVVVGNPAKILQK